MARFANVDRAPVDAAVDQWRDACLVEDGSLFFPGEPVWTLESAQELVQRFNEKQLVDARTFEEKLTEQMQPASQPAVRLMAELIAVYFLFTVAVGGPRKRQVMNNVLALKGDELPEDNLVSQAMDTGIGNPGLGHAAYRPNLLMYLVDFTCRFKAEDEERRVELLTDAWAFKAWLVGEDEQHDGGEQMMRQVLLHLLFPEEFERIASGDHKWRIRETFEGLVEDPHEDIDRALLQIRERLHELMPNGQADIDGAIDFYSPPLQEGWDPDEEGGDEDAGISNLGALEQKRQVILYGPPGTGKTHEAKALARRLLTHQALLRWGAPAFLENQELIEEIAERQIRRLQLHQAYSYEEFVRGLRLTEQGTVPEDGYLLKLIEDINGTQPKNGQQPLPWVLVLDEINRTDLSRLMGEMFSLIEDRNAEVDLSGLDEHGNKRTVQLPEDLFFIGTMNLIDQSVEQLDFALRRRFLWLHAGFVPGVIPQVVEQRWNAYELGHHPWERLQEEIELLAQRASLLNQEIATSRLLGEQYEVGHTYFFDVAGFIRRWPKVRTKGYRPPTYMWKKNGEPLPPLTDLWAHSLRPLLSEYLAGIDPEARKAELRRLADVFLRGKS